MATAAEIRAALRKAFPHPQWALMFEVRNAVGFDANRSADAVAMNTWPSQGLKLIGIEIKVSRSDWRNEIKKPEKAEAIACYCDEWMVAAPKGIVPPDEVPDGWSLREWDGARWVATKAASLNREPKTITRDFLAALLRRASEIDKAEIDALVKARIDEFEKTFHDRIEREVAARTRDHTALKQSVEAFQLASGLEIKSWDGGDLGAVVKIVKELRLTDNYSGVFWLLRRLQSISSVGLQALADLGIEEPEQVDFSAFAPAQRKRKT